MIPPYSTYSNYTVLIPDSDPTTTEDGDSESGSNLENLAGATWVASARCRTSREHSGPWQS